MSRFLSLFLCYSCVVVALIASMFSFFRRRGLFSFLVFFFFVFFVVTRQKIPLFLFIFFLFTACSFCWPFAISKSRLSAPSLNIYYYIQTFSFIYLLSTFSRFKHPNILYFNLPTLTKPEPVKSNLYIDGFRDFVSIV